MINDHIRQQIEILRQHDRWRAEGHFISDMERRAIREFQELRRMEAHFQIFNRVHEIHPRGYINSELQRIRHWYRLYLDSLDTVKVGSFIETAIKKLLTKIKKGLNRYYHLILILREQKRLQQKIKSIHLPIKIIPDSLRPIDFAA